MAIIDLSAGFMAGLPQRILRLGETIGTYIEPYNTSLRMSLAGLVSNGQDQSSGYPGAVLTLMKGAVPTDFSTLQNYTSRSTDVLVSFGGLSNHFSPSQSNVNPAIISTVYVDAVASGTATWFWLVTKSLYDPSVVNTLIHQTIGTVGVTGSGADLEMGSTSIVSGSPYRVLNLRIQFPSIWVV